MGSLRCGYTLLKTEWWWRLREDEDFGLKVGDEIVAVDGEDVQSRLASLSRDVGGSAQRQLALTLLLAGPRDSEGVICTIRKINKVFVKETTSSSVHTSTFQW